MSEIKVVIAGTDEQYLSSLGLGLLKEIGYGVDLSIITDPLYFQTFFAKPQNIDVLLIEKALMSETIRRLHIERVFILQDTEETEDYGDNITGIFKYSSAKEIYHKIGVSGQTPEGRKETGENAGVRTILVFSPIGGSGKTMLSLALARELARFNKRVLYINMESIQNFQWVLRYKDTVDSAFCFGLARHDESIVKGKNALSFIANEEFDYIKPVAGSTISYGIKNEDYVFLIRTFIQSGNYDYIVLDTSSELNQCNMDIMGLADRVVTVVKQDAMSIWKTDGFLENIDYSDQEKFLFVCNCYQESKRNFFLESEYLSGFLPVEYIYRYDQETDVEIFSRMGSEHVMKGCAMYIL